MNKIQHAQESLSAGWLQRLLRRRSDQNLRDVQLSHWPYMLIFPLAPVFANMQDSVLKDQPGLWGLDAMSLMGALYCLGAGVLFAFVRLNGLRRFARWLSLMTFALCLAWVALPSGQASLAVSLLFMFCLGGCAGVAAFGYTYALNDAERLLGAALISLFCMLWQMDFALGFLSGRFSRAYLTALTAGTALCLNRYKTEDYTQATEKKDSKLNAPLLLMLFFFFAHKAVEVFYTYLPDTASKPALIANALMGLVVFAASLLLYFRARFSLWHMCNLFFMGMIVSLLLRSVAPSPAGQAAARYAHGLEQMGFIASYCLLGMVLRQHAGSRLFKGILFFALLGAMLIYMVPGIITKTAPDALPYWAGGVAVISFLVFIVLSPAYVRHVFPQQPLAMQETILKAVPAQPSPDPMAALSPRER